MRFPGLSIVLLLVAAVFAAAPGHAFANENAAAPAATMLNAEKSNADDDASDPLAIKLDELWQTYQASLLNSLNASSDPHDWALAALMQPFDQDETNQRERAALIGRAKAVAPDDVLVQWIGLRISFTHPNTGIDHDATLLALQRLEPDNAAVWMEALVSAARRKDDAAADAALAQMAASKHSDEHIADLMKAQIEVDKRYPMPDEYYVLAAKKFPGFSAQAAPYIYSVAVIAAVALPAYQDIIKACTIDSATGENAGRAAACATVGRMMVTKGTNWVANRIGSAILRRSGTFTDDDVKQARVQDWIYYQDIAPHADPNTEESTQHIVAKMNDWCETNSELESMRREVARAGKPLTPPPDWVDAQSPFSAERLRSDQLAAANVAHRN